MDKPSICYQSSYIVSINTQFIASKHNIHYYLQVEFCKTFGAGRWAPLLWDRGG